MLVTAPASSSGELGDSVALHCRVESSPAARYSWTRGPGHTASLSSLQNLRVRLSERTEGEYRCWGRAPGFPPVSSRPALLLLHSRPSITTSVRDVSGGTARLGCSGRAAPPITGFSWTFLGQTGRADLATGAKYRIETKSTDKFEFENWLIIQNTTTVDSGHYSCTVTNSIGSQEISIHLKIQGTANELLLLLHLFSLIGPLMVCSVCVILGLARLHNIRRAQSNARKPAMFTVLFG